MAPADQRLVRAGLTHPEWTRGGLDSYHAFSIHVSEVRAEGLEPGDRAEPPTQQWQAPEDGEDADAPALSKRQEPCMEAGCAILELSGGCAWAGGHIDVCEGAPTPAFPKPAALALSVLPSLPILNPLCTVLPHGFVWSQCR